MKGTVIIFNFEEELKKYNLTTETYEKLLQDCSNKVQKISDDDWSEIVNKYNLGIHYDSLRKSQQLITGGAFVSEYYKWKESQNKNSDDDSYMKELQIQKRELEKERKKLQTEKLEYNKMLREEARDEMISERICEAISSLQPLDIPERVYSTPSRKEYCLVMGDEHFGAKFKIYDLFGNIINEYSIEIFESRMWDLSNQVIDIIEKEDIGTLNIFSMGDFTDGILRVSQLAKLECGVVDGTIMYANFIANWLNKLTQYVNVKYYSTDGNHSELRELSCPKGTFQDDNMGKVVREIISARLRDNPNFTMITNPTGYIFGTFAGNTVLGIHGEVKNMERSIREFSDIYNVKIQYLIAGHLHHSKTEEVGINSEVINVPSIVGVDTYSMSLHKTSNASAKLIVFEEGKGKVCEYTLKLN